MRRVPGTLSNNNMERSGVREAYNLILEDLDYAMFLKTVINLLKSCFPVSFLLKSWPTWI